MPMIICFATACEYNDGNRAKGEFPQCTKDDGITVTDEIICDDYSEAPSEDD